MLYKHGGGLKPAGDLLVVLSIFYTICEGDIYYFNICFLDYPGLYTDNMAR